MTAPSMTSLVLPTAPPDNKFRILLIESDMKFAEQLLTFMSRTGFDCRLASDSQMGMSAFEQVQPHLLLLQAQTEGFDGLEFCRWARETSGIPIMVMGKNDESSEIAALKIGADDYIPLPLRPSSLMARMVAQLRRAYRYSAQPVRENPFGLPVEEEEGTSTLPSGWAACELCGYQGPRAKFEKEDWLGNIKQICPNCKASEHVVISLN